MVKCDGNLEEKYQHLGKEASNLARSKQDPNVCVYYICDDCLPSYEKSKDFLIETL